MKDTYIGYQCVSIDEWKEIMNYELSISNSFEIHLWSNETDSIKTALKYGDLKESDWEYGVVISGKVTEKFKCMILDESKLEQIQGYYGYTKFFSIFLDTGFSSEHYGTELYKI